MKLAVLLTCFNRKEKTINCINTLLPQLEQLPFEYKIYVCDDQSTDGTYEALKELLTGHEVFQSSGNFYWSKGMHMTMKKAVEDVCDYYLMINDDVEFFEDALNTMLYSYKKHGEKCGIVGATIAISDDAYTYGGRDQKGNKVEPSEKMEECYWANWNCFLVDSEVVQKVGLVDGKYGHAWGDYDYSFRMHKEGFSMYMANDYVGRCDVNSVEGTYRDNKVNRRTRMKKLFEPKGMPFYSYMRYHMKVYGKLGIIKYVYGYFSLVGYILLKKDI